METENRILRSGSQWLVALKKCGEDCRGFNAEATTGDSENSLGSILSRELSEKSTPFSWLEPVHRLDQPVSGCVLYAMTPQVCAQLGELFAARKISKTYLAITELPRPDSIFSAIQPGDKGTLSHQLLWDSKQRKSRVLETSVKTDRRPWKKAELEWHLAGCGERYLFFVIHLLTGRTHQIRAQMANAGVPIKGDLKYGARRSEKAGGIRLHAECIAFADPETGVQVQVQAPVPDFDALWQAFPARQHHT